jgi:hypothetical protein
MKHIYRSIFSFFLITALLCLPASVFALEVGNQSSNIFRFQQKLADNGDSRAQYKLAMMYEAGVGVDKNIEQAKHWYSKAAKAGSKAASDRITFLAIKQQGYQKAKHASWLEGIRADVRENKASAMIILGQMYRSGIGVKKDLNKSLELFYKVNRSGEENVDKEIIAVRSEIAASNAAKASLKKKKKINTATIRQTKIKPTRVIQTDDKQAQAAKKAAEKEKLLAEKRRKYEKVMEQLRLEQKMINEQQARVSGGVAVAVDEEF